MKKLKRLLETGDDKELLEYLRNDFRWKMDKYISIDDRLTQLTKDYIQLAKESDERRARIDALVEKANTALASMDNMGCKV